MFVFTFPKSPKSDSVKTNTYFLSDILFNNVHLSTVVMRVFRGYMNNVKHNLKNKPVVEKPNELTIEIDSNTVATVSFTKLDEHTYDLVHTLIPEQMQGQGLGHILAERIFDHLLENQKKLKLTCEFLQHFYTKNADKYSEHVIVDFKIE